MNEADSSNQSCRHMGVENWLELNDDTGVKVDLFTLQFAGSRSFYARVDNGEKITIAEPFCVLESGHLPICLGMCSVAARMRFDRGEEGAKRIRISFVNDSGKAPALNLETALDVKFPAHATLTTVPFAFLIKQLSLPAFGEYLVHLGVDGNSHATTPLHVRKPVALGF